MTKQELEELKKQVNELQEKIDRIEITEEPDQTKLANWMDLEEISTCDLEDILLYGTHGFGNPDGETEHEKQLQISLLVRMIWVLLKKQKSIEEKLEEIDKNTQPTIKWPWTDPIIPQPWTVPTTPIQPNQPWYYQPTITCEMTTTDDGKKVVQYEVPKCPVIRTYSSAR